MAPRQFQQRLRRSPRNFRQNFRTQAAQHLVAKHIFNLPHDFHIYNRQGGKETIDTLLLVKDSDTWWKAVVNELGRLSNGIDNRVGEINTIKFIRKEEVSTGLTVTYANFVCDCRSLKSEPYRVRLTLGRNIIEYPDDASFPEASLLESKTTF